MEIQRKHCSFYGPFFTLLIRNSTLQNYQNCELYLTSRRVWIWDEKVYPGGVFKTNWSSGGVIFVSYFFSGKKKSLQLEGIELIAFKKSKMRSRSYITCLLWELGVQSCFAFIFRLLARRHPAKVHPSSNLILKTDNTDTMIEIRTIIMNSDI